MTPSIILTEGNPDLHRPGAPVQFPDAALLRDLQMLHLTLEDFRTHKGFGRAIAAPQIGIAKRIIAMNLGATPFALINPRITWRSDQEFEVWDDCLSVPEYVVRVKRHQSISVTYMDELGRLRHWERLPADLAELVQHELDHLDGVLMTARAAGANALRPVSEHAALVDAMRPQHRLSLANIKRAGSVIAPVFLNTPQYDCEPLSEALGCTLTIKLEFANPIRSFKGRGASFLMQELAALAPDDLRPIVAASAGNWGQALAFCCRASGRPLVLYAAVNANPMKVDRMRALGAEVRLEGQDFDAAKQAAQAFAKHSGGCMVADGLNPQVSEGAGTIGSELLARGDAFDAMTVPLGNGALLAGMARWIKAAAPATRMIGVSARGADAMEKSWRNKAMVLPPGVDSIADGIAVRVPIPEAVDDMQGIVDDVLLVSDAHIIEAMRLLYRCAGLLVEPAGAAGVAALIANRERFADQRIATVLCGGNLTENQIKEWIL